MGHKWYVYIMSNQTGSVFQVGKTNFLKQLVEEYRNHLSYGFTSDFHIHRLVYVDEFHSEQEAMERMQQINNLHRFYKIKLIEQQNPYWEDLANRFEF